MEDKDLSFYGMWVETTEGTEKVTESKDGCYCGVCQIIRMVNGDKTHKKYHSRKVKVKFINEADTSTVQTETVSRTNNGCDRE